MLNNPQSFFKKRERVSLHWWEKIKALFGQWLQTRKSIEKSESQNLELYSDPFIINQNTLNDWIAAIDTLALLVQSLRANLDIKNNNEIDLEVLGASIYLFHIDRLLVKIRDHLQTIQNQECYLELENASIILKNQIQELGKQCHLRVLHLTSLIQRIPIKKLYTDQIINQVHTLELEANALGSAIRTLNQNVYKAKTMLRLSSIENALLQSLQSRLSYQDPTLASGCQLNVLHTHEEDLRSKITAISDKQTQVFINGIIDIYQMLKKCYVIARKSVIKQSIDLMAQHIESLIMLNLQSDFNKDQAYYHFNQIFHCIETLRFSANSDNRCSKNLFDKSKFAYFQLRKLCQKNPLGLEYLKQYSIKRVTLLKPK